MDKIDKISVTDGIINTLTLQDLHQSIDRAIAHYEANISDLLHDIEILKNNGKNNAYESGIKMGITIGQRGLISELNHIKNCYNARK